MKFSIHKGIKLPIDGQPEPIIHPGYMVSTEDAITRDLGVTSKLLTLVDR